MAAAEAMSVATAVHGRMALPRAVHRDEAAELAERERHAAYMEAAWEHARVLMEDLQRASSPALPSPEPAVVSRIADQSRSNWVASYIFDLATKIFYTTNCTIK